jgi:hypothetical protein
MKHRASVLALAVTAIAVVPSVSSAQAMGETSHAVASGGISIPGWTGKIDASEAAKGSVLENSKLAVEGSGMHVTTGPSVAYWNPKNMATGDYTVMATFAEPKYMGLNSHPHPYGIMIGGNDLGTDQQSYLYCAAYGDGRFIVRGFGPAAFQLNGRGGAASPAVHKAAAVGEPVSQNIAVTVKGDKVECSINGTTVASFAKADVVGAGRLKSTDGVYGIRFSHNTEATITNFMVMKP